LTLRGLFGKNTKPTWLAPARTAASTASGVERPQILASTGMAPIWAGSRENSSPFAISIGFAPNEPESSCQPCDPVSVIWMIDTIEHGHLGKVERAHTFKASHIDSKLGRVGASLMMRVDPAF